MLNRSIVALVLFAVIAGFATVVVSLLRFGSRFFSRRFWFWFILFFGFVFKQIKVKISVIVIIKFEQ